LNSFYTRPFKPTCLVLFLTVQMFALVAIPVFGQKSNDSTTLKLKKLSIEELLNVEVTSVSMRPEKLSEVASAIQVISGEDIHRSGVTRLPEAFRLVSNLQMEQVNSHDWAITARGFNGLPSTGGILANKLLVMVDGRSVYNPLFGGVFWDVQNVMLEDLDRLEVVSGPGSTLWGANAVNGVINVVSKSAKETQGLVATTSSGSFLQNITQARYGFHIDSSLFIRVYGQRFDQRSTVLENGKNGKDAWSMNQGGFRLDYYASKKNTLTFQGDLYDGASNDSTAHANTNGQNLLAHFVRKISDRSNLSIKAYYDRTWRKTPSSATPFAYQLNTYDIDIQHRFPIKQNHSVLWGVAYRFQKDQTTAALYPPQKNMPLYSGFIQDEIAVVPEVIKFTVGSKFLNNVFTGFEFQPSARFAWTPSKSNTWWAAVSRAVRIPTRFDSDVTLTSKFNSEKVLAYEAGYRVRPVEELSLSFSTFYNKYSSLRSIDTAAGTTQGIVVANSQRAESWGFEFSGNYQATRWWHLRGGFTYFDKNISPTSPKVLPLSGPFEGVDPKNIFMFQSVMDLKEHWQLDLTGRYVDALRGVPPGYPIVPSYFTFDARIAWNFNSLEFSCVGQNLWADQHTEVGLSRIPRTIYGKVTWRF